MPIFTRFLPLSSVVTIDVGGQLQGWDGSYEVTPNGHRPAQGGSGLKLRAPAIQSPHQNFPQQYSAYVIVSCRYPLVYVGISDGGPTGLAQRLHKHLNKFLAIPAPGTHHPENWKLHGRQRHQDNFAANPLAPPGSWMLDDLRIAFVCNPVSLKANEGFILSHFVDVTRRRFPNMDLAELNGSIPPAEPIQLDWPENEVNPCSHLTEDHSIRETAEIPCLELNNAPEVPSTLGDDFYIPGVDPEATDSEETIAERERRIGDWIQRRGREGESISDILGRSVNTVEPHGVLGGCHGELHVPVEFAEEVAQLLWQSAEVLDKCPEISLVVFHVAGNLGYLEWMNSFLPWRNAFRSPKRRIAVRVTATWSPRICLGNGAVAQNWAGALPRGPGANGAQIPVAAPHRARLRHRVWLLEELGVLSADYNYIGLHVNQPPLVGNGPDISFGTLVGENIQKWRARIYFPTITNSRGNSAREQLPLGFPLDSINFNNPETNFWNTRSQSTGPERWPSSWSPLDLESFLKNPYQYLSKSAFPASR